MGFLVIVVKSLWSAPMWIFMFKSEFYCGVEVALEIFERLELFALLVPR